MHPRGIGPKDPAPDYDDGDLCVRPGDYVAIAHGRVVVLPALQLALLAEFTRHPDQVRTREQLRDAVWGPVEGRLRVVDTAVARLRSALSEALPDRQYIHTHAKLGYRFSAENAPTS